jgi:hypothetical protein
LREAGFSLFKVDFLFGASYEGRHYDPGATGVSTLRSALRLVREAVGEEAWLVLVQAPWLAGAEVADFYRQSHDVVFSFFGIAWPFFEAEARGTVARFFSHNLLFRSDPDHILLREPSSLEEARSVVTYGGLAGGLWLLGDVLADLPQERLDLARNPEILGLVGDQQGAVPLDLFEETDPFPIIEPNMTYLAELLGVSRWANARLPRLWSRPQGDGVVILGIFNWQDEMDERTWGTEELGLGPGAGNFRVEDLWTGHSWQITSQEGLSLSLEPHASSLLRISPITSGSS